MRTRSGLTEPEAAFVDAVLGSVDGSPVVICSIDDFLPVDDAHGGDVSCCRDDQLGAVLAGAEDGPAVVWFEGHVTWHGLEALRPVLAAAFEGDGHRPTLVVLGDVVEGIPAWASPAAAASQMRRRCTARAGVRTAARAIADDLGLRFFWLDSRRGVGIAVPEDRSAAGAASVEVSGLVDLLSDELARSEAAVIAGHELLAAVLPAPTTTEPQPGRVQADGGGAPRIVSARRSPAAVPRWMRRTKRIFERSNRQQEPASSPGDRLGGADRRLRSLRGPEPEPPDGEGLRITYYLPSLQVGGGILGVTQLANELRLLGADARVVALRDRAEIYEWRLLARPTIYGHEDRLRAELPPTDVLVATHWSTASAVHDLVAQGRARVGAYFLQDYEAWFYPNDAALQDEARRTYDLLPHKIVKSDWLAGLLRADGHATEKIPIGMDLGFFFPRRVRRPDRQVVLAMGRPRTPRRGFDSIVDAFEIVAESRPETEFVFFGEDLGGRHLPFCYRCEGVVTDQERLAELYAEATVHFDGSVFQAFGRPALEAMACGTPSVLTDVGGVGEYARDGVNCLLVPPAAPERAAEALLRLLDDAGLRRSIVEDGFRTVRTYSMRLEARRTLRLFQALVRDGCAQEAGTG